MHYLVLGTTVFCGKFLLLLKMHGRQMLTDTSVWGQACQWQTNKDGGDPQYWHVDGDC